MGSYSDNEEDQFFDTREEISSLSDRGSDCSEDCSSNVDFPNGVLDCNQYEVWIKNPESVHIRRHKFLKWMGLSLDGSSMTREDELFSESTDKTQLDVDRMADSSGVVLRTLDSDDGRSSSMSSQSYEARESSENDILERNSLCTFRNLNDVTQYLVDELYQDRMLSRLHEVQSNLSDHFEEFQSTIGSSISFQHYLGRCVDQAKSAASSPLVKHYLNRYVDHTEGMVEAAKKANKSWLRKLGLAARFINRHKAASRCSDSESSVGDRRERVKVSPSKKKFKELSSLYARQEFLAHKGSILTMKFSLDGQYLATGGEDGVVRVWKVIEDDRSDPIDFPTNDRSCLYFTINHLSKSLDVDKESIGNGKRQKSSDSTCVVFPPKVFKVLENPQHEFQGHSGEVLDLSWSEKRFLLSSSTDKTVRLWQVGCDRCLRVFIHNNYVTCVDFNTADENYFISGSIDGKVRIWEVIRCQVVDYTDIKEIVTAVCFRPSGKGGIVGTMTGNCLFYDIIDNRLQLDVQICLQGKKKVQGKRITGFEFCPSDPNKVVVTSADSLIRVLCGMEVICKFKASTIGIAANQLFASFTKDGKHLISTSEDSNVYVWDYNSQERSSRIKSLQSYESFTSQNASIAIPWRGIETVPETSSSTATCQNIHRSGEKDGHNHPQFPIELDQKVLHFAQDCFSLTREFLLESLTRGSATWPEEKLHDSGLAAFSAAKLKSDYRFLKNACQSMFNSSHLWGLVIVTAGWDGRIRTYLNYGLPLRL